ncbi:2668_t:CDS:2 [Entrophospora sp. SA101]|nr:9234_t:CDS:2 [Entrophospora sp. SA101]CAJ0650344.1 11844_t:CDS:2 [Entrophospora sp. SA101]CAJ0745090.1 2668_t:CDS:2 [Entrophospora sp. SA101]CAJ0829387.1 3484_t:CDS:2 [Entrophospora sp. SA101]CAJ0840047.1 3859_t:CDS:2 [Entrophospora sp. SA101]
MSYSYLLPLSYKEDIKAWLKEDVPSFDYGGFVVGNTLENAILYGKSPGVLAGVPFFNEVFSQLNCSVDWFLEEGECFEPVKEIAHVTGRACDILLGERTALNILARCSGIARRSKRCITLKETHKFQGIIAGTRKTTPGFRLVEKYGMLVGGVDTHRMDLSSMIMLKDNHVWSQGSITKAVLKAREVGGFSLKIEVECRTEEEANEAIQVGADIIMLDNLKGDDLKSTAKSLKEKWTGKSFLLESSGGITEHNITDYFCPDIDVLSLGSLSQGVPHVDFSLKIKKPSI